MVQPPLRSMGQGLLFVDGGFLFRAAAFLFGTARVFFIGAGFFFGATAVLFRTAGLFGFFLAARASATTFLGLVLRHDDTGSNQCGGQQSDGFDVHGDFLWLMMKCVQWIDTAHQSLPLVRS